MRLKPQCCKLRYFPPLLTINIFLIFRGNLAAAQKIDHACVSLLNFKCVERHFRGQRPVSDENIARI